jgi:hypothetical protein
LVLNFACGLLATRFTWIPPLHGFFYAIPGWLCTSLFAVHFYHLHADNLLTMFTLLQRLTTILRPFDNENKAGCFVARDWFTGNCR